MDFSLWLLFIFTFASALVIPGANVAYAVAQSMNFGPRYGLLASAGFALASGLNLAVVMAGLGVLLSQYTFILAYLKWIGVAYLLYLAFRAFNAPAANPQTKQHTSESRVFGFAVLVSLSNPKVVLMNLMLLPLFLTSEKSIISQGFVIITTGMCLSFLVYSAYALFAARMLAHFKTRTANRIVGTAYVGAAFALARVDR